MKLEEARAAVGRQVVYVPYHKSGIPVDEGVITSVNEAWVFVRYGRQQGSQATSPGDLQLVAAPEGPPPGERGTP